MVQASNMTLLSLLLYENVGIMEISGDGAIV